MLKLFRASSILYPLLLSHAEFSSLEALENIRVPIYSDSSNCILFPRCDHLRDLSVEMIPNAFSWTHELPRRMHALSLESCWIHRSSLHHPVFAEQGGQGLHLEEKVVQMKSGEWMFKKTMRIGRNWMRTGKNGRRSCETLKSSRISQKRFRTASRMTCSRNCRWWSQGGMTSCQNAGRIYLKEWTRKS